MSNQETMVVLHDKATRGLFLSAGERAELDVWYATQDREEAKMLHTSQLSPLSDLQQQIETGLANLQQSAQNLQRLTLENERLRQEINTLSRQLTPTKTVQNV